MCYSVSTSGAIWGEWIAEAPAIIFTTLTLVEKSDLSQTDGFIIISVFCCLLSGFMIILQPTYSRGIVFFGLSCICFIPVLYLPRYVSIVQKDNESGHLKNGLSQKISVKLNAHLHVKRISLCIFLVIIFSIFPLNYILGMLHLFSSAMTIACYQMLSLITKAFFSYFCLDIHGEFFKIIKQVLDDEIQANESRRSFMKYVLHEVRGPLNSVKVGTELLSEKSDINEEDMELLETMKSSNIYHL